MTKKDYIKLAAALNSVYRSFPHYRLVIAACVDKFSAVAQQDNPRFDNVRFYNAVFGEKEG